MSIEKALQNTELSRRSLSTGSPSTLENEKTTTDISSASREAVAINGKPDDDSPVVNKVDLDEAEYPTGLAFVLVIMALFLCVFLTALDMVCFASLLATGSYYKFLCSNRC